ncbi:uncharacterized protein LOC127749125 [Frankliniella occidentalis]|uniref:Uncharacterized protein LOC127749125 n=1 Tax=Frankliniella occidentalis TaxID=133901 RepID=A0A9C6TX85_FRAOC|nr:uncharacterized protein LOC127749125 [Frankliniella occidentalis]
MDDLEQRASGSSTSVAMRSPDGGEGSGSEPDDEDGHVYADSFRTHHWIFIGDSEEARVWQPPDERDRGEHHGQGDAGAAGAGEAGAGGRRGSTESTNSERDFRNRFTYITHRMVHRKVAGEMYRRRLASEPIECDKTVNVRRGSGEFGLRVHGARPVVVASVEPESPALSSGLEVGDILISVNGVNVLEAPHSEVIRIAHAGSEQLQLEVARTCHVLTPTVREPGARSPLFSGHLWRLGSGDTRWLRRWVCLRKDNSLYYYKTDAETDPLGALQLAGYAASRCPDAGPPAGAGGASATRPHCFRLSRHRGPTVTFAADNEEAAMRWLAVLGHAIERNNHAEQWLEASRYNLRLAPSAVLHPDCIGYLEWLDRRWRSWRRRYCVLKDACIFYYRSGGADSALGMACLHGYRLLSTTIAGRRHVFEMIPPLVHQRHFFFSTETEMDKKRWMSAMEYSILRWVKVA